MSLLGYPWVIVLALVSLHSNRAVMADVKDDVCKNMKPAGSKTVVAADEFSFIDVFNAKVEGVAPNLQRILHAEMYFVNYYKMLRVNVFSDDWEYHSFHDYKTHETSTYSTLSGKPRTCKVDHNMRGGEGFYLVPHNVPEGADDVLITTILRMGGPSGFSSGEDIELIRQPNTVTFRDLTCTQYVSCQNFFDENGDEMVMKVTHLISSTSFDQAEDGTIPVQIKLEGKYISGSNANTDVSFVYNFYHYRKGVESVFELPLGVVCEDRKTVQDFPKLPEYMSFGQEIHYPDSKKKIETVETSFDSVRNYVKETYFNPDGSVREVRLDDFNSGLSFNMQARGACDVKKISDRSKINDFVSNTGGSIQMVTPEQFFHSGGIQFHYSGEKKFHYYLKTEVWSGKDKNTGHIYSWFFTKNVDDGINTYAKVFQGQPHRVPHKRMIWENEESEPTTTYFYKVDFTEPTLRLDSSLCYQGYPKFVYIYLPGLELQQLEKNEHLVKKRIHQTLVDALEINWLRINYFYVEFYGDLGFVLFQLFGKPKIEGDKVQGVDMKEEPTLEEAYDLLKKKLDDGLVFNVGNEDELIETQGKLEDPPYANSIHLNRGSGGGSSGYSSGALAGLAIAMTILGLAAGGAGAFWFFFKRS